MIINKSSLTEAQLAELRRIVGEGNVNTGSADRWALSRDMWPKTVMWTRHGQAPHLPDAVVLPSSTAEVSAILKWADVNRITVTPYGAGSGVSGGGVPLAGGIVVDVKRMNHLLKIDIENMCIDVEPGIYGERLERMLNAQGLTHGHFPSSIYCSSVGGYVAARSAGQASSRYGKMEDMLVGLEVVLPGGEIVETAALPSCTALPDLNQIFLGSEGTLGIITRIRMRVHTLSPEHRYLAYHFPGVKAGLDAMRRVMQAGLQPAVLRLYDEFDTIVAGTHGAPGPQEEATIIEQRSRYEIFVDDLSSFMKKSSIRPVLKHPGLLNSAIRRLPAKCLLVIVCEGDKTQAERESRLIADICSPLAMADLGEGPARYWEKHRYKISYKQSKIFDAGAWVDTMEVAIKWSEVEKLYQAVRRAVQNKVFIMAHFSHAYVDGCCIYFSFSRASSSQAAELSDYDDTWRTALRTIHENGGTITHHHGVGCNKAPFIPDEYGVLKELYVKIKKELDPHAIMNPGKLMPDTIDAKELRP